MFPSEEVRPMSAATLFDEIVALPQNERANLFRRLAVETDVLEHDLEAGLFDSGMQEYRSGLAVDLGQFLQGSTPRL